MLLKIEHVSKNRTHLFAENQCVCSCAIRKQQTINQFEGF